MFDSQSSLLNMKTISRAADSPLSPTPKLEASVRQGTSKFWKDGSRTASAPSSRVTMSVHRFISRESRIAYSIQDKASSTPLIRPSTSSTSTCRRTWPSSMSGPAVCSSARVRLRTPEPPPCSCLWKLHISWSASGYHDQPRSCLKHWPAS